MKGTLASGPSFYVANDLVLRPSCTRLGSWLVSWGEGYERETLEVSAEVAAVFAALPSPVRESDIKVALGATMAAENSARLIGYLIGNGMLARKPKPIASSERRLLAMNWNDALVMHRATRGMLWRHEYPANAQVMTWTNHDTPVPVDEPRPVAQFSDLRDSLSLSEPRMDKLAVPVEEVFAKRRTKRSFRGSVVPEWMLSTLLHAAFRPIIEGVNRRYFTTLSSADGYRERAELHPMIAHVLFGREAVIPGQEDAVYRYNPETHALQTVRAGNLPGYFRFSELLWGQDFADKAPAAVLLSVNWPQFMWKYRDSHAYRFTHYDLGAYMHTAQLVSTALGMGAFITPAIDDVRMARLLGSSEHLWSPSYFLAIGAGRKTGELDDTSVPYM